jgi:hypothetical protein
MAIITSTFLTYSAIGNREELSNTIYNISPEDTPFISNIGKDKVDATLFEWQTDALAAAAANAQFQGDDIATFDAVTATARIGNRTMISRKTAIISGTQDAVQKAGRKTELAYQVAKKSAELKRDMELNIIGLNLAGVTGSSGVAPVTATMTAFIKTNVDMGASGVNPTYTSGVPNLPRTDGTVRLFTETILKNVLQLCWTNGAKPELLMTGPINKQRAGAFSGIATRFRDVQAGKQAQIIGSADVYVSDFGQVSIVPNRFQRERDAWAIDTDYAAVAFLRPFQQMALAKTGDAEKRMILVEYGLKIMNEAAHGLAADLQTT